MATATTATKFKALSIRAPWAQAIMSTSRGRKNVENRSWATAYHGPLVIHCGKSTADLGGVTFTHIRQCGLKLDPDSIQRGVILGVVDLVDVIDAASPDGNVLRNKKPWADLLAEHYWIMERPRLLPEPIPYPGSLGLFDVTDPAIVRAIQAIL